MCTYMYAYAYVYVYISPRRKYISAYVSKKRKFRWEWVVNCSHTVTQVHL